MKARWSQLCEICVMVAVLFHFGQTTLRADEIHLSLASALDRARMQNPQVAIARARVLESEGMREQAGLLPNPVLYGSSENTPLSGSQPFTFGNDTDDYIYLIQKVELGGKRGRRIAFAAENAGVTAIQSEIATRQLLGRVALAYWMAAGSAAIARLYQREVSTLADIVGYNGARVQKGATAEADLIRIELESDRLKAQSRSAAQQARRSLIGLYREMGATDYPDSIGFSDRLEDLHEIRPPNIESIFRERAEMREAQENVKAAQANLDLQRANAVPDPQLMAGYKRYSGSGKYTGQNTLFFGVQVPLPIFDRNQGGIAAAQARLHLANSALKNEEIAIGAEIAAAQSDYASRRQALLKLMPQMLSRAAETSEVAEGAYRLGGADILRFLDAARINIETHVLYVQTLVDYQQSAVNLQLATGMLR